MYETREQVREISNTIQELTGMEAYYRGGLMVVDVPGGESDLMNERLAPHGLRLMDHPNPQVVIPPVDHRVMVVSRADQPAGESA